VKGRYVDAECIFSVRELVTGAGKQFQFSMTFNQFFYDIGTKTKSIFYFLWCTCKFKAFT